MSMPDTVTVAMPPSAACTVRLRLWPPPSSDRVTGAGQGAVSAASGAVQWKVTVTGERYHP